MTDVLQKARKRHEEIVDAIAQLEADIENLTAEAKKLERFVLLADELFASKADEAPEPRRQEDVAADQPAAGAAQPGPEATDAISRPDAPRVMPIRQPKSA